MDVNPVPPQNETAQGKSTPQTSAADEEPRPRTSRQLSFNESYELLKKSQNKGTTSSSESLSSSSLVGNDSDDSFVTEEIKLEKVKTVVNVLEQSPLDVPRYKRSSLYRSNKMNKISDALKSNVEDPVVEGKGEKITLNTNDPVIKYQIEQYKKLTDRTKKIQFLTMLPPGLSYKQVNDTFGASKRLFKRAKELSEEKGPMATPNQNHGHPLPETTVKDVVDYYLEEHNSRIFPGKNDNKMVKTKIIDENGIEKIVKELKQKRLVLKNLSELYANFQKEHPDCKIGFTKFCELRPEYCILAGAPGTHTVCVCTTHQNFDLLLYGSHLKQLTESYNDPCLKNYKDCIAAVVCKEPNESCYLMKCKNCPGVLQLSNKLEGIFEEKMIDSITYKKWLPDEKKRWKLETLTKTTDEFLEEFTESLEKLVTHEFISEKQAQYFQNLKRNLKEGEVLIVGDFSENYAFIIQNSVQGFYWTNYYATVHVFVGYYKEGDELKHFNYVIISECQDHVTSGVYLFQTKLIEYMKNKFGNKFNKIYYYSDGAGAQYKNRKNFLNLCKHEVDFEINAEWHFFATSHGKSACDGIGGIVKSTAAKASLQRPEDDQITNTKELFDFLSGHFKGIDFAYCTQQEHEDIVKFLAERFSDSKPLPETRKIHCVVPQNEFTVHTKYFSLSENHKKHYTSISKT